MPQNHKAKEKTPQEREKQPEQRIVSFMKRAGRMSSSQKQDYIEHKDKYLIPFSNSLLKLSKTFPASKKYVVEIGFGMGDTTASIARKNPTVAYLGLEVHTPGVARLVSLSEEFSLANIKIIEEDAFKVLTKMIPDGSLDGIHLFFPDPWKKRCHHKRRFLNEENTILLASKIKQGGYFYAATDWAHYAAQMDRVLEGSILFKKGEKEQIPDRDETKFERKGIRLGHEISEFFYSRI